MSILLRYFGLENPFYMIFNGFLHRNFYTHMHAINYSYTIMGFKNLMKIYIILILYHFNLEFNKIVFILSISLETFTPLSCFKKISSSSIIVTITLWKWQQIFDRRNLPGDSLYLSNNIKKLCNLFKGQVVLKKNKIKRQIVVLYFIFLEIFCIYISFLF